MADSVFHKDFKSMPWWWEWWHPSTEPVSYTHLTLPTIYSV